MAALESMRDGEIEVMCESTSGCELYNDSGGVMGLVQKGHHAPWSLRQYAVWEGYRDFLDEAGWPRRTYMREMPYSLLYPDEPPCDEGPETILWVPCKRDAVGAVPVTVLDL